jgi:hypothetical protein
MLNGDEFHEVLKEIDRHSGKGVILVPVVQKTTVKLLK